MIPVLTFDLETDSPEPTEAHIVTAYLGVLDASGAIVKEQEWLVRPEGFTIPQGAIDIHGITNEHATAHGRPLGEVLLQIASIVKAECVEGGLPLAGQNISYDLTVLNHEAARTFEGQGAEWLIDGLNVLDSYVLDKKLNKYRKGSGARKLINLAAAYGVHLTEAEAHGARSDAIAAGRIVQKQLANDRLRGMPLEVIHEAEVYWRAEQCADLQAWFRTKGGKPDATVNPEWPYQKRAS